MALARSTGAGLCALLALSAPRVARAEATPEGSTFPILSPPAVTRFPDVAYDPSAGSFLVVSGQQGIAARFVGAAGVEGEPFPISEDPTAYSPRVASAGGGFIACWLVEADYSVRCRRIAPGSPPTLGAPQVLTTGTVSHLESAPSVACSLTASECLVTWVEQAELAVRGRRIDLDAEPIGEPIDIAVNDGVFEAFPAVACAEARGEFFVVHTREPNDQPMAIAARRSKVGDDSTVGEGFELFASNGLANYPEVAYDARREQYLSISWFIESNSDVAGRLAAADGAPIGDRIPVAASAGFEGGDGIGLAFDPAADSYLAVFQGPETPGEPQQVWAAPVGGDGAPRESFQVTSGSVDKGVYQPRVASDGAGRFLVVTVVDYLHIDGQFVKMDVEQGAATGAGGAGGGSGTGAGDGGDGESADDAAAVPDGGGCGCMTAPSHRPGERLPLLAALLALFASARRRDCRTASPQIRKQIGTPGRRSCR